MALFQKKIVEKGTLGLKCPHCREVITDIQWRFFGENAEVWLIGCGNCMFTLGTTFVHKK